MRIRTTCVAAALSLCSASVHAQTVLSEADALTRLSNDSPRVRAIRAGVELARADVIAASRWPNPRVTFNREAVAGVTENMFTVTQLLPITGRRGFEISAASALADASARRVDDDVRRARAEMRVAYADLVSAQVREVEFGRARDRLSDVAGMLARRESAGDAAGYDRLRAEREVVDVESELVTARGDRLRAQAALGSFFSDLADPTTLVVAVPDSRPRTALPSIEDLLQRAEATRGESAALREEISAAQFSEQAATRRLVPEPEIVGGTKSSNVNRGDVGSVVSVHVSIPLFDRSRPERAMARAKLAEAQARLDAFHAALRAQVIGLRSLVAERRDMADRYRASSTSSAAELERIAQVSYDAGERGILELLDAYRNGASARTRQAALDAAVRQAEIELEFVSGWEMQ